MTKRCTASYTNVVSTGDNEAEVVQYECALPLYHEGDHRFTRWYIDIITPGPANDCENGDCETCKLATELAEEPSLTNHLRLENAHFRELYEAERALADLLAVTLTEVIGEIDYLNAATAEAASRALAAYGEARDS